MKLTKHKLTKITSHQPVNRRHVLNLVWNLVWKSRSCVIPPIIDLIVNGAAPPKIAESYKLLDILLNAFALRNCISRSSMINCFVVNLQTWTCDPEGILRGVLTIPNDFMMFTFMWQCSTISAVRAYSSRSVKASIGYGKIWGGAWSEFWRGFPHNFLIFEGDFPQFGDFLI